MTAMPARAIETEAKPRRRAGFRRFPGFGRRSGGDCGWRSIQRGHFVAAAERTVASAGDAVAGMARYVAATGRNVAASPFPGRRPGA